MADESIDAFKACTKCGVSKSLSEYHSKAGAKGGRNPSCKACYNAVRRAGFDLERNRQACKKWRADNLGLSRLLDRARYVGERREKRQDRGKADWANLTPDAKALKAVALKEWKAANPELVQAMDRRNRLNNPETHRKRQQRWRQENPIAAAAARDRRRAAQSGASGSYSADDIRHLLQTQGRVCRYCDCRLTKFHVDHFVPLARGGSNGPENLALSCPTCNLRKGAKMPWDWMPERFDKPPN